ncbi:MAG: hypothetical protein ACK4SX_09185 [Alcanivoracaceae bacterium]
MNRTGTMLAGLLGLTVPLQAVSYTPEEMDERFSALQRQIAASQPRISFNGFLSFVGATHSEREGTYDKRTVDGRPSFESLSRFGLQMEYRITDDTRVVAQLLSKGWDGWRTNAEWAFVAHDLTSDLTVRAGRLRLPVYMNSEFIDAGFAYPWVTPPTELYTLIPFTSYEGLDFKYNFDALNGFWTFQPYAGFVRLTPGEERVGTARGDDLHGFDLTANWGNFTARAGYMGVRVTVDDFPLTNVALGINQSIRDGIATTAANQAADAALILADCGPGGAADFVTCSAVKQGTFDAVYGATLAQLAIDLPDPDLSWRNTRTRFYTVGLSYDDGRWLGITEFGKSTQNGWLPDTTSCYGTVGYRIGRFLPHLTYSHVRIDDPDKRSFDNVSWTAPPPAPPLPIPNPAGSFIEAVYQIDQESWTAGVRYDHRRGLALKADVQRVGGFAGNGSGFFTPPTGGDTPDHLWIYRVSLDVMF